MQRLRRCYGRRCADGAIPVAANSREKRLLHNFTRLRAQRTRPRQIAGHKPNGEPTMTRRAYTETTLYRKNRPRRDTDRSSPAAADATLEFGHFRVLLRRRQLVADGVPVELGTRAFDLLLVLLEADGSLVTKDELVSRVWPGIVVAEENLKVQISALRKALGGDRDLIRTEFGRGYRFTATIRSAVASSACQRPTRRRHRSSQSLALQWICPRSPARLCVRVHTSRRFDRANS
jgi:DNA-binding winged helix-turn-helix (wHTH) protein